MLSPRGHSGLEAKILASVSASKLCSRPQPWPQTLASVCSKRTSSQEEIDGPICLHFSLPTTGHHTMIEDSYCARENEKLNCTCRFDHNDINSPVGCICCQTSLFWYFIHNNIFGLGVGLHLKKLASALTSKVWPRPQDPGLGLEILASFNITGLLP